MTHCNAGVLKKADLNLQAAFVFVYVADDCVLLDLLKPFFRTSEYNQ